MARSPRFVTPEMAATQRAIGDAFAATTSSAADINTMYHQLSTVLANVERDPETGNAIIDRTFWLALIDAVAPLSATSHDLLKTLAITGNRALGIPSRTLADHVPFTAQTITRWAREADTDQD